MPGRKELDQAQDEQPLQQRQPDEHAIGDRHQRVIQRRDSSASALGPDPFAREPAGISRSIRCHRERSAAVQAGRRRGPRRASEVQPVQGILRPRRVGGPAVAGSEVAPSPRGAGHTRNGALRQVPGTRAAQCPRRATRARRHQDQRERPRDPETARRSSPARAGMRTAEHARASGAACRRAPRRELSSAASRARSPSSTCSAARSHVRSPSSSIPAARGARAGRGRRGALDRRAGASGSGRRASADRRDRSVPASIRSRARRRAARSHHLEATSDGLVSERTIPTVASA